MTRYKLLTWDTDVEWQYDAACLGVVARTGDDPFFRGDETTGRSSRVKHAKSFCKVCPVVQQCLQFALDNGCSGVWGNTTERERKRMKKGLGVGWLEDAEANDPCYHRCHGVLCVTCGLCSGCCSGPHGFAVDELVSEG